MAYKLADDNLKLFESGFFADVEIICGKDHQVIRAHKAILANRSPYFNAAFDGNWKEATSGKVLLEDRNAETVSMVLEYIYTGGLRYLNLKNRDVPKATSTFLKTCVELWIDADYFLVEDLTETVFWRIKVSTNAQICKLWTFQLDAQDDGEMPFEVGVSSADDEKKKLATELSQALTEAIRVAYTSSAARPLQKMLCVFSLAMRHHFQAPAKLMDEIPGFRTDTSAILLHVHRNPTLCDIVRDSNNLSCNMCGAVFETDGRYRSYVMANPVTRGNRLWCAGCAGDAFLGLMRRIIHDAMPE